MSRDPLSGSPADTYYSPLTKREWDMVERLGKFDMWDDDRGAAAVELEGLAIEYHRMQIVAAFAAGRISEGQAMKLTAWDRLTLRAMRDDAFAYADAKWKEHRAEHLPKL